VSFQSRDEVHRDYHAFFELLGHFVTRYQSVEDYLVHVFASLLAEDKERSKAIFATARGIDPKLKLIDAALIGHDRSTQRMWKSLRKCVSKAHETRGYLAHCSPISTGRIVVSLDDDQPGYSTRWMEARKLTRKGERAWKTDDLKAELNLVSKLLDALIAFVHLRTGKRPADHLMAALSELTQ